MLNFSEKLFVVIFKNFFSLSFIQSLAEGEDDLRIVYSMATICYILNDWSSINVEKMAKYIKSCLVCGIIYPLKSTILSFLLYRPMSMVLVKSLEPKHMVA